MVEPADITDALEALKARQKAYAHYAAYYAGKHDLKFATDAFRQAFGHMFKTMAYNRCRSVVDAYADRLNVTGWETPGIEEGQTDALGQAATDIWNRNRMPKRQGELFTEAFRSGDAYLIVWPGDDGLARLDINAGHLIEPVYDDEYPERLTMAVKCWQIARGSDKGKWRVNTYDGEAITRWITSNARSERPVKANALIPYESDTEPAETFHDYGAVPVFHLGNDAPTGWYGASELCDVIPLQDGMNKNLNDMLVVSEYAAYRQRWAVGVEPVVNPRTNEDDEAFKPGVDRLWAVADPDAKFGEFDASDMAQFVSVQESWDRKISNVSRVPLHWLGMQGEFPSGESLKTAEGPFTSKIKDRQTAFGDVLGDALAYALHIEQGAPIDTDLQPIWQPAETRSELEALQQATMKKALGLPDAQLWAELGYSQEEIAEFTAAKEEAEQKRMEQFATSFDRGGTPPFGG